MFFRDVTNDIDCPRFDTMTNTHVNEDKKLKKEYVDYAMLTNFNRWKLIQ
jgi:hypothetical protein